MSVIINECKGPLALLLNSKRSNLWQFEANNIENNSCTPFLSLLSEKRKLLVYHNLPINAVQKPPNSMDCIFYCKLWTYLLFISCRDMTEVFAGLPEQDVLLTEFFLEKFLQGCRLQEFLYGLGWSGELSHSSAAVETSSGETNYQV